MRNWVSYLIAVLVFAGGASGAQARKKTVRAAILPSETGDLPASLGTRLQGVIARELKAIGVFRLVPARVTRRKIRRLQRRKIFVAGCTGNPRCVRRVGRNLRAKVLYRLKVVRAEEGLDLSLGAFDVRSGKEIRTDSELASDDPKDIDRAVRWLSRRVSSPMLTTLARGKGRLQIDCNRKGATLFLNGKSFGKRTGKSFKVSSGVFDIQVKKEGFETFHDVVVVKVGQTKRVKARLEKSSVTRPVEVAGAPAGTGEEAGAEKPKPDSKTAPGKQGVKTSDLPAWAVFEKPKPKPKPESAPAAGQDPGKSKTADDQDAAVMPWQKPKKSEPYLPGPEREAPGEADAGREDDAAFYQTWWFWTIVGAGAVAAGGTAAYFTLFADEGGAGKGSALVRWE